MLAPLMNPPIDHTSRGAEPGGILYRAHHVEPGRLLPEHTLPTEVNSAQCSVGISANSVGTADSHQEFCPLIAASSEGP